MSMNELHGIAAVITGMVVIAVILFFASRGQFVGALQCKGLLSPTSLTIRRRVARKSHVPRAQIYVRQGTTVQVVQLGNAEALQLAEILEKAAREATRD